ncbi:DNA glycosylase [Plectosphaerella plurivora]|uniref:DNA glycosylase n=1 Tax=Plectosphaerella plurivora TaxID=936078 RepID=A0A9P8VLE3_9PEZI|nr:DNA glycosylase [Plectosphaerella plurivora]
MLAMVDHLSYTVIAHSAQIQLQEPQKQTAISRPVHACQSSFRHRSMHPANTRWLTCLLSPSSHALPRAHPRLPTSGITSRQPWHRSLLQKEHITLRTHSRTFSVTSIVMAGTRRSARLGSQSQVQPETVMPPPPAPASPKGRKRKATTTATATGAPASEELPPVTPPPKRRAQRPADSGAPPVTPTPGAVGLMAERLASINGTDSKKPRAQAVARLADPASTNAPLLSPETSRVIVPGAAPGTSPSKAPRLDSSSSLVGTENHKAPTTTSNILEKACAHLISVDERMRPLIEKNPCRVFSPEGLSEKIDPFESLCSGIISQQVSGAAAKSIKAKFVALFDKEGGAGDRFPHPSDVASRTLEQLRKAGLSQRKAEYIYGLAEKFASGELSAQMLAEASYEDVLSKLIAVRGLGQWSVEMFACFALKRMDVFSLGDLGVQRGMAAFMGRDVSKLKAKGGGKWKYMSEKEMLEISAKFAPYRSVFMWYMWRVEETDISTLE